MSNEITEYQSYILEQITDLVNKFSAENITANFDFTGKIQMFDLEENTGWFEIVFTEDNQFTIPEEYMDYQPALHKLGVTDDLTLFAQAIVDDYNEYL